MKMFGEMVDETMSFLRAFVRDQEMSTHLTESIAFGELEIPVADANVITRGRIEIDDELIWVDRSDRSKGVAVVPPYGRGMDSTSKADHAAGTRVIVQPLYPRKKVKDLLNQAIRQAGTQLYGVEIITLTPDPTTFLYPLPEYTREVLSVKVSDVRGRAVDSDVVWLRNWTYDKNAPRNVAPSGKGLYLYDEYLDPTIDVTVTISRDPAELWFETQLFTESFLPETSWDVVVNLAGSRLLSTATAYYLQGRSVEANQLDSKIDFRDAPNQSKYLYSLGTTRLGEERQRLLNKTMQRVHYSRR